MNAQIAEVAVAAIATRAMREVFMKKSRSLPYLPPPFSLSSIDRDRLAAIDTIPSKAMISISTRHGIPVAWQAVKQGWHR
jgi:hypothetical protein